VSENLGRGVYDDDADRNADLDIFIKSVRENAKKELIDYFHMNARRAGEITIGIVRSQMTYEKRARIVSAN